MSHLVCEDETVLNEQMAFLKGINEKLAQIASDLNQASPAAEKLSDAMQDIQERVRNIIKSLIKKAQKLLVAYAFEYYKDEAKLEEYLIGIEVLNPEESNLSNIPSIINRSLILGVMFGLLIGPLFGIIRDEDIIYYCWRGSFALMLFAGCISYGVHSGSWKRSVLIASFGGYSAHLLWNTNKQVLYAIATLSGAVFYPLLYLAFGGQAIEYTVLLLAAGIGAIAMSSLALAVNIVKATGKQPSAPQPQNDPNLCLGCNHSQDQVASH